MPRRFIPSPAMAVALLALFVALTGTALAAYVVSSNADIAPNTVYGSHLPAGANENIVRGSVGSSDLASSAVTNGKLGPGAVTDTKLADGAVTNTKLGNLAVTETKLGNGSVKNGKINNGAVSVSKLAPDVLTRIDDLPDVLPAGETVRGTYGARQVAGSGSVAADDAEGISWGLPMAQDPVYHVIPDGAAVPAGCSGTVGAPGADPGHVCIFEGFSFNASDPFLCAAATAGCNTRFGTVILMAAAASGLWDSWGTWAATGV